ncbi:MAG TPA: hypothetical protein VMB91_08590 [Solirubrobacteraceae bacterium]|nr:hypothetical protein [Solirubrobacteraceae bacterium]
MSKRKHYGDPRRQEASEAQAEAARERRGRSKTELSVGYIFFAWIVFFILLIFVHSLVIAAVVLLALLGVGGGILSRSGRS